MKFVSFLVAICFSMNVFASTGSIKAVEAALDDYHFALNVEWDQKDPTFKEAKTKEFTDKVQFLIASGSVSQQDITSAVENKIKNKSTVEAMKLHAAMAANSSSTDELVKFLGDSSNDFYSQGASWHGRTAANVLFGALLALGIAMYISATFGCQEYAQRCDWAGCHNDYDNCVDYGYVGPHL